MYIKVYHVDWSICCRKINIAIGLCCRATLTCRASNKVFQHVRIWHFQPNTGAGNTYKKTYSIYVYFSLTLLSVWGRLMIWLCVGPYTEVWCPQWFNPLGTQDSFGTPFACSVIPRLPKLRFRSSKDYRTWIWSLWTYLFNVVTYCDNPVPLWRLPWRNMMSWFWTYGAITAPKS